MSRVRIVGSFVLAMAVDYIALQRYSSASPGFPRRSRQGVSMAITLVNPEGLPKVDVYRQVAVGAGSELVFIAGQVAGDADGVTVGVGDLAAQVERCFLNDATALAGVGGTFD